ncbi:FkbM family methyltransferase [Thermofilum sp.]|uniref:FkbM family methyltransferase n=1 Tax=Thermofilum sp. TaxID=1961369 RepID=UPI003162BC4A
MAEKERLNIKLLLKSLFYFLIFILCEMFRVKRSFKLLDRLTLVIIPFSYLFICRFGEAYTVISAFIRRYYDIVEGFIRCAREEPVVVDIGAHIGTFTVRWAKKLRRREGLLISVEPEPTNYALLRLNLLLNKVKSVITVPVAINSSTGEGKLYLHGTTGHSLVFRSSTFIRVRRYALDDLMKKLKLETKRVSLIKINAEGSELQILMGARHTLKNVRCLIIAAHHRPEDPRILSEFLKGMGFSTKCYVFRGNKLVVAHRG